MKKRWLIHIILATFFLFSFIPVQAKQSSRRLLRKDTLKLEKGVLALRKSMVRREETIVLRIPLYHRPAKDVPGKMFKKAFAPTAKGEEGDYLYWSVSSCSMKYTLARKKHGCLMTLTYNLKYRTSRRQEEKIAETLEKARKDWAKDSFVQKVQKINSYICENLEFDKKITGKSYNVYHALRRKKGVCLVYSMLYYRLATDSGIPCRIITGAIEDKEGNQTPHSWNVVKARGMYYHTDLSYYDSSGKNQYLFKIWAQFYDQRLVREDFSGFCVGSGEDPPTISSDNKDTHSMTAKQ